ADRVREQDPVAEGVEPVMSPDVDPEEGQADDRELRQPVRPRDGSHEDARGRRDVLERELEEVAHPLLQADDAPPVLESRRRVAIGDPACKLVRQQEAEPDRQLARKVTPTPRQVATTDRVNGGSQSGGILTSRAAASRAGSAAGRGLLLATGADFLNVFENGVDLPTIPGRV